MPEPKGDRTKDTTLPSKMVLGESKTYQKQVQGRQRDRQTMPHAGVQTLKVQGAGKMGEDTKGSHSGKGVGVRSPEDTGAGVLLGERALVCLLWVGCTPPARSPSRNPGVRSSQHLPRPCPEASLKGSLPLSRLTPMDAHLQLPPSLPHLFSTWTPG